MKKFIAVSFVLSLCLVAQGIDTTQTPFNMGGGLGISSMHDTIWGSVELQPEFGFGPVGIGMKLDFRVSQRGKFRTEDWNSLEDWVGKIRYVRLGRKRSPFYARVGVLNQLTLGYGFIMDNYTNNIDENTRIVGLEFRSDLKKAGFDIAISHLASPIRRIFGIRPYIRPIKFIANVPILSNFDVGLEFIRDGKIDPINHIEFLGIDAGLPILNTSFISFGPYYSWAHAISYGSGSGIGFRTDINLIMNILHISAKLERRNINGEFIPSYFNPLYEAKKEDYFQTLKQASSANGVFGELYGSAIGKIRLGGSYEYYPGVDSSGSIHLEADAPNFLRFGRRRVPVLVMYDKCMLTSANFGKDAFTRDDRLLVTAQISYEVLPHIYFTGVYKRRFAKDPNTETYEPLDKWGGKLEFRP